MGAIGLRGGLGACVKYHCLWLCFFLSFFVSSYRSPRLTDFHDLYVKRRVFAQGSAFWGIDDEFSHLPPPLSPPKFENLHYGLWQLRMAIMWPTQISGTFTISTPLSIFLRLPLYLYLSSVSVLASVPYQSLYSHDLVLHEVVLHLGQILMASSPCDSRISVGLDLQVPTNVWTILTLQLNCQGKASLPLSVLASVSQSAMYHWHCISIRVPLLYVSPLSGT